MPDRVFDEADEVVLVDLPPDDLLARLKQGKVYLPEQAERAVRNFFRKGNLLALRELALRRTADRVDDEMKSYRRDHVGGDVWKARDALLVAIGPKEGPTPSSVRPRGSPPRSTRRGTPSTSRRRRCSSSPRPTAARSSPRSSSPRTWAARRPPCPGTDVVRSLVDYARAHNLGRVMLGRARGEPSWLDPLPARARRAHRRPRVRPRRRRRQPCGPTGRGAASVASASDVRWHRYGMALAISAVTALVALALFDLLDIVNTVMLFLLAVVVIAATQGRGPAVAAAVVNVLAFDFLFVPPRFSFAVSDVRYLFTFAVMLGGRASSSRS